MPRLNHTRKPVHIGRWLASEQVLEWAGPLARRYPYLVRELTDEGKQVGAFEATAGRNGTVVVREDVTTEPLVFGKQRQHYSRIAWADPRWSPEYSPNPVKDDREQDIENCANILKIPEAQRPAFKQLIDDFLEAGDAATARAKPGPRPKWPHDALPDENAAQFAHRAGYLHRGEISTEDRALHKKLFNWLRTHKWPADVPYIPTLPEWNERQAEKLPELLARVGVDVLEVRRLEAVAKRVARAQRIPAI